MNPLDPYCIFDTEPCPPPKPPVTERKCAKCKNATLREVTQPTSYLPTAFCKLCGHEEEI